MKIETRRRRRYRRGNTKKMVLFAQALVFLSCLAVLVNLFLLQLHRNRCSTRHRRRPLVVFGAARTGSNLLFDAFRLLGDEFNTTASFSPNFRELFSADHTNGMKELFEEVHQGCARWSEHEMAKLISDSHQARFTRPMELIRHILEIPSKVPLAYFAFKIFPEHMDGLLHMRPVEFIQRFIHTADENREGKYIILWRRRVISSWVSFAIAVQKREWFSATTTRADAVPVYRRQLANEIARRRRYYLEVQQTLDDMGVEYEVIEYDRDLSDTDKQVETLHRLADFLNVSSWQSSDIKAALAHQLFVKKQATVSLEDQVTNWEEVVRWGYGGETEEWEDLFPVRGTPNTTT